LRQPETCGAYHFVLPRQFDGPPQQLLGLALLARLLSVKHQCRQDERLFGFLQATSTCREIPAASFWTIAMSSKRKWTGRSIQPLAGACSQMALASSKPFRLMNARARLL